MSLVRIDLDEMTSAVVGKMPSVSEEEVAVALSLYRLLSEGSPGSSERLAEASGRPEEQVRAVLARRLLRRGRGCGDILAANRLGYALFSEMYVGPTRPANTARFVILDARSPNFFVDWERVANDVVATLRSEAGRDPYDRGPSDLVGELSTQSETFRTRWAAHNVRFHDTGVKRIHHPVVGDLILTYETMELSVDAGLTVAVYTAEPSSRFEEALNLLASWAADARSGGDSPHDGPILTRPPYSVTFGCPSMASVSQTRWRLSSMHQSRPPPPVTSYCHCSSSSPLTDRVPRLPLTGSLASCSRCQLALSARRARPQS